MKIHSQKVVLPISFGMQFSDDFEMKFNSETHENKFMAPHQWSNSLPW